MTRRLFTSAAPVCICGCTTYEVVCSGCHRRLGGDREFMVIACARCSLGRTLPVPDARQYDAGYAHSTEAGQFVERCDTWSAPRARWIRDRAPAARTLLDIGCNDGRLVVEALSLGFDAQGIDVDPIATQWARERGRPVFTGDVDELTRSYDVVVAAHTIEHVGNPLTFLRTCYERTGPGGRVFIFTPNRRSVFPRMMGPNWMLWAPAEHVWHFTPMVLANLARGAGLAVNEVTARGVLEPPSKGPKGQVKRLLSGLAPRFDLADQLEGDFVRRA